MQMYIYLESYKISKAVHANMKIIRPNVDGWGKSNNVASEELATDFV